MKMSKLALIAMAISMPALMMLAGCYSNIGPGHVGILVQNSGTDKGVLNAPVKTGRVWYNPMSETVIEYPTNVQTVVWTENKNEGNPTDESVTFTNKDSMAINADISLSYSLDPGKVPAFYVKFLSDKLEDFTNGFLHSVARDCLNENAGKYEIDQLMGDNAEFLKTSRNCIDSRVSQYGVHLEQFGIIGAPRPPQAVINNINAKIQASQLGLQKQMELQQVQADAAKQIAAAEGNAKAQIAAANGEAEANRIRNASTTPTILQLKTLENQRAMIDKWNGTSPTTVLQSDGKSVILQLPKE